LFLSTKSAADAANGDKPLTESFAGMLHHEKHLQLIRAVRGKLRWDAIRDAMLLRRPVARKPSASPDRARCANNQVKETSRSALSWAANGSFGVESLFLGRAPVGSFRSKKSDTARFADQR
jgi:hypothetical protein